jgi:hypothetical protein
MNELERKEIIDYMHGDMHLNNKLRRAVAKAERANLIPNFQGMYFDGYGKEPFAIGQNAEQIALLRNGILAGHLFLAFGRFTVNRGKIKNNFISFEQWIYNSVNWTKSAPNPGYFIGSSSDGRHYEGSWKANYGEPGRARIGNFELFRMDLTP